MKLSPSATTGGALIVGAALLLISLAIIPYSWQASLTAQAAAQQAQLDLLTAKLAARQGRGGPVLSDAQPLDTMFLPGSTAGTTLASFQERVSTAAVVSGLAVLRMQPLPEEENGQLASYRLSVDVTGRIEQLRAFLVDIEAMLPLVIVTGFDIGPQSDGEDGQAYPSENLAASLRLEAYGWKGMP